ncbi:HAMP domain-containing histidine kinase [Halococcus agarilyticus]|nr:HAMP domain-containing histidine kinase [Halococcus agarilyticus]
MPGLGLTIVDTLVEAHGWEIALDGDGAEARFEVVFGPSDPLPVRRPSE